MTLTEGIEASITAKVPEITSVVDVTDHAAGANPWLDPNAATMDPSGSPFDESSIGQPNLEPRGEIDEQRR